MLLGKSFSLVKVFTNSPLVRSRQLSGQNGTLMLRGGHAGDFFRYGKIVNGIESQHRGDLSKGVDLFADQFLGPLDLHLYEVLLDTAVHFLIKQPFRIAAGKRRH